MKKRLDTIISKMKGFSMKNSKLVYSLCLSICATIAIKPAPKGLDTLPTNPCSTYAKKTIESLKITTKHTQTILKENKDLLAKSDQVYEKLQTIGNSDEVKNILTKEQQTHIKNIVDDHATTIKNQVNIFIKDGIKPEIKIMEQRIKSVVQNEQEKLKNLETRIKATTNEFFDDPKVQDSVKNIEAEGKKLEKKLKDLFKSK